MEIPDYQTLMLPILKVCADGSEHTLRELVDTLAVEFALTEEARKELLPSGRQPIFDNRIGWAKTYLKKAGLLDAPKRAHVVITDRGRQVLAQVPTRIDVAFLKQFEEFVAFHDTSRDSATADSGVTPAALDGSETPEEALENAYQQLRESLIDEVLEKVKSCSPEFFERLVVELLVAMGYGGSRNDAGQRLGKSGDGGIDGIIKEDRLGLDIIYIQAKRWENSVGRPEVQKFVGALQGQRARKGVFLTTSTFTKEAQEYAANLESKVILVDGPLLAQYMIDSGIGVSNVASYNVKRVDSDYFSEE
ncbi:MAG: restriction endonuclease [Candidatus Hydrogenedentes bacterium]|nr:restriction endonuclease [Candidatus Hydrogenedentota bacterium]